MMDIERLIGVIWSVHKVSYRLFVRGTIRMIECENDRYLRSTIRQSLQFEHENYGLQTALLTCLHQPLRYNRGQTAIKQYKRQI